MLLPREGALIKEAIKKRNSKRWTSFYLYNKVEDMEQQVLKLQKLVPEAKNYYAHGTNEQNIT